MTCRFARTVRRSCGRLIGSRTPPGGKPTGDLDVVVEDRKAALTAARPRSCHAADRILQGLLGARGRRLIMVRIPGCMRVALVAFMALRRGVGGQVHALSRRGCAERRSHALESRTTPGVSVGLCDSEHGLVGPVSARVAGAVDVGQWARSGVFVTCSRRERPIQTSCSTIANNVAAGLPVCCCCGCLAFGPALRTRVWHRICCSRAAHRLSTGMMRTFRTIRPRQQEKLYDYVLEILAPHCCAAGRHRYRVDGLRRCRIVSATCNSATDRSCAHTCRSPGPGGLLHPGVRCCPRKGCRPSADGQSVPSGTLGQPRRRQHAGPLQCDRSQL